MVAYPDTPPRTGTHSSTSGPKRRGNINYNYGPPLSPVTQGSFRERERERGELGEGNGSVLRTASTSSVEAILSSCDPSLLHIAPVLYELGIQRVDHLRAIVRLSEDTRDREVKAQALRRGVTVVEWAIFLDKLQSL